MKPKDLDYAFEGSFEELYNYVTQEIKAEVLVEIPQFLVIRARLPNKEVVDFNCCRGESGYDGRRPSSTNTTNIYNDLARRDFTVNAMAMPVDPHTLEINGNIIDMYGGQVDLLTKTIDFVGNADDRIQEDGLRWLRAIRFCVTKNFQLSKASADAIYNIEYDPLLMVSTERVREELTKCFKFNTLGTLTWLKDLPPYWLRDELWLKPTTEL